MDKYVSDPDEMDEPQFFDWAREKGGDDELFQKCVTRFEKKYFNLRKIALARKNEIHNSNKLVAFRKQQTDEYKKVMHRSQNQVHKLKKKIQLIETSSEKVLNE